MAVFIDLEERLSKDPDPMRKMWAMVLLMAIRDNASSVHYHSWRGDGALSYIIANIRYDMRSPQAEHAVWCIDAARSFLGRRHGYLRHLFFGRRNLECGSLILGVGGHRIEWEGVCWLSGDRKGVEFYRVAPQVDPSDMVRTLSEAMNEADAWGLHDRVEILPPP